MARIFESTEPQHGDTLNTILAKRLQALGGQSNWGATDEEIEAEISKIPVFTSRQVQDAVNQVQSGVDQVNVDLDKTNTKIVTQSVLTLAAASAAVAAPTNTSVIVGTDWSFQAKPAVSGMFRIAYGNGIFVAISYGGVVYSVNGVDWVPVNGGPRPGWSDVCFGNGLFVVVDFDNGVTGFAATSPDGVNWTSRTVPGRDWSQIAFGNGKFVALNQSSLYSMTSTDGVTWVEHTIGLGAMGVHAMAYGSGLYVAMGLGNSSKVFRSVDGVTWATASGAGTGGAGELWSGLAFGNGKFVACSQSGEIQTSTDAINWGLSQPVSSDLRSNGDAVLGGASSIVFGSGVFVVVLNTGQGLNISDSVSTSLNGYTWTGRGGIALADNWSSIAYGAGMYVAVSTNGATLTSGSYVSDIVVPKSRRIDWTGTVGVSGGIPTRNTIYQTLVLDTTGATNVGPAIQTALDNCPAEQVVYLPAGTYRVDEQLLITKSNITFRGAGMGQTIIKGWTSSGGAQWGIVKFQSGLLSGVTNALNITSGAVKGSTGLVLASSDSNLHSGYIVYVDQLNGTGGIVDNNGVDGARTDADSRANGTRCNSQQVKITGIAGGVTVSFEPKLVWDFTLTPQLFYRRSSSTTENYLARSGVEDMTLQRVSPVNSANVGQHNVVFYYCNECWAKNIETLDANTSHITSFRSYRVEIRGCTCKRSFWTATGGGYGIDLEYQTCSSLVEDNIFDTVRDNVKLDAGSVGNVIIYNYHNNATPMSAQPTYVVATGGSHSAHPMMNLWEGNIFYTPRFDFTWGSSSHQTLLRNWFRGPMPYAAGCGGALKIDQKASFYNVVGNVLGSVLQAINPNYPNKRSLSVAPTSAANPLYSTLRIGYRSDDQITSGYDGPGLWANTIAAGNYDYIAGTQVWYNPTTPLTIPDSYFYTSKPAYFSTLVWPPINPAGPVVGEEVIPAGYRFAHGVNP